MSVKLPFIIKTIISINNIALAYIKNFQKEKVEKIERE